MGSEDILQFEFTCLTKIQSMYSKSAKSLLRMTAHKG